MKKKISSALYSMILVISIVAQAAGASTGTEDAWVITDAQVQQALRARFADDSLTAHALAAVPAHRGFVLVAGLPYPASGADEFFVMMRCANPSSCLPFLAVARSQYLSHQHRLNLRKPDGVKPGRRLKAVWQRGGARITFSVTTLNTCAVGDSIRVRTSAGGKIMKGILLEDLRVELK